MQSGKIKHWNQEKGYGFIDVDDQNEDVFFHVSTVRLSQPISIGQSVYFNSKRNDKNQLRATEVTSTLLSIQDDATPNLPKRSTNDKHKERQTSHQRSGHSRQHHHNHNHQPKKSGLSTLFGFIAIIAVAFYFFGDITSTLFTGEDQQTATNNSSQATNSNQATSSITGDAQVDKTIALIQQGGPYPYPNKDGTTFYNREGRLPAQSQGYYREYTVPTPGVSHRGARRIVTGGYPPTVYYLTVDHYDSFRKLQVK